MPGIFDEEWCPSGQIWLNPFGTWPISLLDGVAKVLKWPALRRLSRLAGNKIGHAGTTSMTVNWP